VKFEIKQAGKPRHNMTIGQHKQRYVKKIKFYYSRKWVGNKVRKYVWRIFLWL